jgi:hypothetical protein
MDVKQFNELIVIPTLKDIGLYSQSAAELVLGTAVYESGGLRYIKQLGGGPALGVCQMELATHDDIWVRYLPQKPDIVIELNKICGIGRYDPKELMYNLRYAVAMCRVHYLRVPKQLPEAGDYVKQAEYYKKYYNTKNGRGSEDGYLSAYSMWVLNGT